MTETPKLHLPKKFSAEPIAIVGLGCIFPDAPNIDEFWQNIVTGKNSIIEVPKDRWDPDLYYDPDPSVPDKTYTKIGGFVTNFKLNPIEYRIPPNVLEQIDPVQQWALASAKQALEEAGYEDEDFPRERCAVIIGNSLGGEKSFEVSQRVYFPAMVRALKTSENFNKLNKEEQDQLIADLEKKYKKNIPVINEDSMPGELANIVAGRIAATFNLRGKNQTTDAACASSLAAIDTAFKGLQAHEFDAAVVGGADRSNDPPSYVKFSKIGALSADGSFPFDERANGFVPGEGAGVMVVKRLSDAVAAGDKIYALITGIGASSDGKGKGITAPNPIGQELAVRRALESADIEPDEIQLIEAHGTSTSVGDFVEVSTAEKIFREAKITPHSVKIGSIKSQIGHLKSAAGAAGLLKTALALHHRTFPPSINFEKPNPKIDWETSPFVVNTHPLEWKVPNGHPRRAGVSSFGFGGTNFHVIMEEYDPKRTYASEVEIYGAAGTDHTPDMSYSEYVERNKDLEPEALLLSGQSSVEVLEKLDLLKAQIGTTTKMDDINELTLLEKISDLGFDHNHQVRVGLTPPSLSELQNYIDLTKGALEDKAKRGLAKARGVFVSEGMPDGKLAFVFPGQGSQYADMLVDLSKKYKIVKDTFDQADAILEDMLDKPLSSYIKSDGRELRTAEEELRQTQFTQPAVLTVDIALHRLLTQHGIVPDMVAGHSLGEYAALVSAGVLSFEDALQAVAIRGRAMSEVDSEDKGTMASIAADTDTVEEILKKIDGYVIAANKNSLSTTVISGSTEGVTNAIKVFEEKGINVTPLSVSAAFHTEIVEPAAEPLSEFLDSITFHSPHTPLTSNVSGEFFPDDPEEIRELMKQQVGAPVEWTKQVQSMYQQGATRFFEVGPKRALSTFVDDILADKQIISVICNHPKKGGIKTLNEAVAAAAALGYAVSIPPEGSNVYHKEFEWNERIRPTIVRAKPEINANPEVTTQTQQVTTQPSGSVTTDNYQEFIQKTLEYMESEGGKIAKFGLNLDKIVISGVGVGLPGKHKEVFDEHNVDRILKGENLIDQLPKDKLDGQLDKNIRRLIKRSSGDAEFHTPSGYDEVIRLAGQAGKFDLVEEFHVDEDMASTFDQTTELAVAAGLEALKDAGIPLVREYRRTTTGSFLPGGWVLPEELQDSTGVIFSSAFPGFDSMVHEVNEYNQKKFRDRAKRLFTEMYGEVSRRVKEDEPKNYLLSKLENELEDLEKNLDDYYFNRKILLNVLSFGHAQFAQLIKARGPNTQINAACASTTQALGLANDWIRAGRCDRVIIISADNVTSDNLFEWLGSGFLASGAASIKDDVKEAALPFDRRRGGMIVGMGAAGLVVESESECLRRGVTPIVELMGTHYANSAYHGTRLDVHHVSGELSKFLERIAKIYELTPEDIGRSLMFMSHETYTPRRGGSAAAEIQSLRDNFGSVASKIHIANTKGFTGHPMGAGIEDAIAIKAMEKGQIPPIANFKEPDPDLGNLQLSKGGKVPVDYALRLAAGFGSQIAFALYKKRASGNRFGPAYDDWLNSINGNRDELYHHGKTLKLKDKGIPSRRATKIAKPQQKIGASATVTKPTPVQSAIPSGIDKESVVTRIQDVISEMTGYPKSMLDPALDMEADLGIDTVKQAEIFGVVREEWGLERDDSVMISDYPTIDAVAAYFAGEAPLTAKEISTQQVAQSSTTPSSTPPAKPSSAKAMSSDDRDEVKDNVMKMLAEQTGYPVEMLDPELDMEADLGIDTVKQAELFGVIREEYGIGRDDDLVIADYPTINHVVDFVMDRFGESGTSQPSPVASTPTAKPKIAPINEPVKVEQSLKDKVLEVISSHTGYPPMMLDDSINLSNDLGVDVETKALIAKELADQFDTDASKLQSAETVGDLLQLLSGSEIDAVVVSEEKSAPAKIEPKSKQETPSSTKPVEKPADQAEVFDALIGIISEHTGYPPEMLDPDLDLEADLGIDTVKQAEIFGQARDKFGIPRIDEMQIADYNTINKLSDFLYEKSGESEAIQSPEIETHVTLPSKVVADTHRYVIRMNTVPKEGEFEGTGFVIAVEKDHTLAENTSMEAVASLENLKLEEQTTLVFVNPNEKIIPNLTKFFTFLKTNIDHLDRLALALNSNTNSPTIHHMTPMQGAIGGMFKALAMEFDIRTKIVIFETQDQLFSELSLPEVEVIYSGGERLVVALSEENLEQTNYNLPQNAVLLASGGAQGITYEMVKRIASPGSILILLGRTKIRDDAEEIASLNPEELDKRKWIFNDELKQKEEKVTPVMLEREWSKITKSAAVYKHLEELRETGAEVHYYSVDITSSKKVKTVFKKINSLIVEGRPITHFIHGAGIEISRATKSKDEKEFNLVYNVKVKGFENLLAGLRLDSLERIIAFSSVAGRFGNATQIDYSAANEYLAKRCGELDRSGIRSTVIDWSAWADIGMATRGSTMQVLESQGVTPIPMEEGIQRFVDELAQGREVEVLISGELGALASKATWFRPDFYRGIMMDNYDSSTLSATRTLSLAKDRYLDDHRIDDKAVLPGVMGLEMMAEVARAVKNQSVNTIFDVNFSSKIKLAHDNDLDVKVETKRIGQSLQFELKSKFIGPDGKQLGDLREHFSSRMHTGVRMPGFPVLHKKQISSLLGSSRMSQKSIYEVFFHGPSYQVIKSVNLIEEKSILATFKQPAKHMFKEEEELEIFPLAIEAGFQTAGLHLLLTDKIRGLPSAIDAVYFFETNKTPILIRAIHQGSTDTHARYNVEIIDEDGNVVILLLGYSMIFTGQPEFVPEIKTKSNSELTAIRQLAGSLDKDLVSVVVDCLEDVTEPFIEQFLTISEQTRFSGIKVKKKRREWLAGRIAAKLALSKVERVMLDDIEIVKDENRSPHTWLRGRKVDVSITHSNGIALAISGSKTVDVEKIEERSKGFISESFSDEEVEKLDLDIASSVEITTYWTMKEAHLKRMRIGLKTDLHGVSIDPVDEHTTKVSSPQGESMCRSMISGDWVLTLADQAFAD